MGQSCLVPFCGGRVDFRPWFPISDHQKKTDPGRQGGLAIFTGYFQVSGTKTPSAISPLPTEERPDKKFLPNEEVEVALSPGLKTTSGDPIEPITFSFTITPLAKPIQFDKSYKSEELNNNGTLSNAATQFSISNQVKIDSLPDDFPEFIITGSGDTAPGLLFGGNTSSVDSIGSYNMVKRLILLVIGILGLIGLPLFVVLSFDRTVEIIIKRKDLSADTTRLFRPLFRIYKRFLVFFISAFWATLIACLIHPRAWIIRSSRIFSILFIVVFIIAIFDMLRRVRL